MGGRASCNRKNKRNPSDQPMPAFLAATPRFTGGGLRNRHKPSRESIARHLARRIEALSKSVQTLRAQANAGN